MAYRVAICDDSAADARFVHEMLDRWSNRHALPVQVELYPSAESFLFRYTEEKNFDILLLDIEMGPMDGVSLAKRLRSENETLQIVFITGYSDYISEGYEVSALHYLMKPVHEEKLFSVLDRAAEKLRKNERTIHLEMSDETIRIPCYQIRYVDVQANYVTVHGNKNYTVKKTLGEIESMLDDRFYRVGRSAIVNLTCISRVTKKEVYLTDGTMIPLPRGAYDGINRAIIGMR